jgi:hypothetical protein
MGMLFLWLVKFVSRRHDAIVKTTTPETVLVCGLKPSFNEKREEGAMAHHLKKPRE